jgi:pimeloyl-ACP methyl ester carboxylesterase
MTIRILLTATALSLPASLCVPVLAQPAAQTDVSDAALLRDLPGFTDGYAQAGNVRLHYVIGGKGKPLVLLPGWPETWWSFHKMMPALARDHRVIVVDLRGMGNSDKPATGYDKKTMAKDILGLVRKLGFDKVDIVGHDIGSQVAYSFAANFPASTRKLVLLDVPHPDAALAKWTLLPPVDGLGDRATDGHSFAWWFAFHQVTGLPEDLMADGRIEIEQRWFFHYLTADDSAIDVRDRAVYAQAYRAREAIRAGNAWYQAFPQDIVDDGTYARLEMPVLALGGPGYTWLKSTLPAKTTDLRVVKIENSGHFIPEEQPDVAAKLISDFLNGSAAEVIPRISESAAVKSSASGN